MTDAGPAVNPPRVFISYSWDSPSHQAWVLQLATRLVRNGVDVVLDQWDARLGSDLPLFMEQGLSDADRVLAICTTTYVEKANAAKGGVGYERRLLTADLMKDLTSARVIPIIRDNPRGDLPRFLEAAKYLNFRDETVFEDKYAELIYELHGRQLLPRPALGPSPFAQVPQTEVPLSLRHDPARYASPALSGKVTFDHSNNNGHYVLGSGDMTFTLDTGEAGRGCVYILRDAAGIKSVALAEKVNEPSEITDASAYDASSRHRMVRVGDSATGTTTGLSCAWTTFTPGTVRREEGPRSLSATPFSRTGRQISRILEREQVGSAYISRSRVGWPAALWGSAAALVLWYGLMDGLLGGKWWPATVGA